MKNGHRILKLFMVISLATTGVAAGAMPASAAVVSNTWQSFVTFPVNTCNGEFVPVFNGTAHTVQKLQSDGTFLSHLNGHFVADGTLGNTYELNWQEDFVSSSAEVSSSSRQLIISKGAAPNHLVTFTFRFPPGEFTAVEDCRG